MKAKTLRLSLIFNFTFFILHSHSAVPREWDADVAHPATHQDSAYQGETIELTARLVRGRVPFAVPAGATAGLWWRTNGMDRYWGPAPAEVSTNGVVSATWSPTNDVGAAAYRGFLGVSLSGDGSNITYAANFTLRMLDSPGFSPNALPLPARTIDFSAVSALNAPWVETESDPVFSEWANANTNSAGVVKKAVFAEDSDMAAHAYTANTAQSAYTAERSDMASGYVPGGGIDRAIRAAIEASTNYTDEVAAGHATSSDLATVRAAATNAQAAAEAAALDASLTHSMLVGSNVVAEVTNYNSRVHAPTLRLLQLSESNEYFQVWAETNGLARTLAAANAHSDTNRSELAADVAATYAPRAWSQTTSGLGEEAPEGVTWVSTKLVVSDNYEYRKVVTASGEVWVLAATSLSMGSDANGYFRLETGDGEAIIEVARTDAQLVGVNADGITCRGSTVTIPINTVSAIEPTAYACTNLTDHSWFEVDMGNADNPPWLTDASMTSASGGWVFSCTANSGATFFQFRILQEGSTVIRHNALTDLSRGIVVGGTNYYPVVNGNTLTWQSL